MASQQQVNSDWIKYQQSQGAYDAGGTTDYQKGMLTNAPAGYFSEAAKKNRYDTGVNTATALQESGGNSFQDYQSGASDSDFLETVYQNETGRASDVAGKGYWQEQMNAGMGREDVIKAFGNTQEGMGFDNPNQPGLLGAAASGYDPTGYNATRGVSTSYQAPDAAKTTDYTAGRQDVTPEQLSIDQLNDITSTDSPYMRQARLSGRLSANRRGLLNSSISAGAAEAAAIQAAQPFAMQDAQTQFTVGRDYTNAANRASEFGASAENVSSLQDNRNINEAVRFGAESEDRVNTAFTKETNIASRYSADAINRAGELYANAQNAASLQNANNELKMSLAQIDMDLAYYKTDEQRSAQLDTIAANLIKTGLASGVFNDPEVARGYFQTISNVIPDLGLQVITDMADQLPADYIA